MIHVYALSYRVTDFVKSSLDSLLDNTSEKINLTIVDNKSKNSEEISKYVCSLVDQGKVNRYIQLEKNVQIMAFNQALNMYPPDNSEDFFVLTELDLIVKNFDWLKETRSMMKEGNVLSGFRLSLENYKPPNGGHVDDGISCGFWLMALKKDLFFKVCPLNIALADHRVRWYMSNYGRMKQNSNCLYHLGWDLHKIDPEYFNEKVKGIKWNLYERSAIQFIHEKKS